MEASMAVSEVSPATILDVLRPAGVPVVVPPHSVLFVQGDEAAGIHLLHAGQVKLSMNSSRGRTLILKICEAGDILGLHNCVSLGFAVDGRWSPRLGSGQALVDGPSSALRAGSSEPARVSRPPQLAGRQNQAAATGDWVVASAGTAYEVSAESLQRCEITFVRRDDFLRLLAREPQVLQAVAGQLSRECHTAYGLIHSLAISNCISERLARLLLDLAEQQSPESSAGTGDARLAAGDCTRVSVGLTHEEIAQMIGTSRETVTRLLKEFRTRRLATLKGSTLHIMDRPALQQLAPADAHATSLFGLPRPPQRANSGRTGDPGSFSGSAAAARSGR
jgi:CRP-like cAMP-binding protein